jgi:hypothetical protein
MMCASSQGEQKDSVSIIPTSVFAGMATPEIKSRRCDKDSVSLIRSERKPDFHSGVKRLHAAIKRVDAPAIVVYSPAPIPFGIGSLALYSA